MDFKFLKTQVTFCCYDNQTPLATRLMWLQRKHPTMGFCIETVARTGST